MAFIEDNIVMIGSLAVTVVFAVFSIVLGHLLGKSQPKVEKLILMWLLFDALIHFLLEGPFVFLSLTGTVNSSTHFTSIVWKEYGKADSRWLYSDPTIVSLEILTVTIDAILCLVLIHAILTKAFYRHFVQLTLCVCELYGGWMTFCPEWLTGSRNLDTSNFMFLWIYLFFFNFLWVAIPAALMYHSWEAMRKAFPTPGSGGHRRQPQASGQAKAQGKMTNQGGKSKKTK